MTAVTVTRDNFDEAVLRASATRPVLVDFWAPWCAPCRALAPILDRVMLDFDGRLTLAKLNTDSESELAMRYGIRGIPNCKLFVNGKVTDEFTGVLPEPAIRDFLARALPSPAASVVARAKELLVANNAAAALAALDEADTDEADEDLLLTRAEVLLALDRAQEAMAAIERVEREARPGGRRLRDERRLSAIKARAALASGAEVDLAALAQNVDATPIDCQAKLDYARALAGKGDYAAALEQLLAIVRADRRFDDDVARRTILTIFEALPPDSDLVRRYRRELASALN